MASGSDHLGLVAELAASYLRRNSVAVDQIETVVRNVTAALAEAEQQLGGATSKEAERGAGSETEPQAAPRPAPAVPIEESVQQEHLVCLEDGMQVRTLKRHL